MDTIREIEEQMAALAVRIKETRDRLPAHSVKPGIMMELLDLEDEYETLMEKLAAMKKPHS